MIPVELECETRRQNSGLYRRGRWKRQEAPDLKVIATERGIVPGIRVQLLLQPGVTAEVRTCTEQGVELVGHKSYFHPERLAVDTTA